MAEPGFEPRSPGSCWPREAGLGGWTQGLQLGLHLFPGSLECHTCHVLGDASPATAPLLASVSPLMSAKVPGFHIRALGSAQHGAWAPVSSLGQGLGPFLPHLRANTLRPSVPPPAAPPSPPQREGRAEPPPRRPCPRGDGELMQGECSQDGVSKRQARRGGAARRGGPLSALGCCLDRGQRRERQLQGPPTLTALGV